MKNDISVISVNISEKKGTIKIPVSEIELDILGVKNDAHAGKWHRQVSLLGRESVDKFKPVLGREILNGEFAENITTQGILLYETKPLDRLIIGDVEIEVTQIGKECHGTSCAIFREVGKCVMPKEGIFARVIKPGKIKSGDRIIYKPKIFNMLIITLSDRASSGEYSDRSGPEVDKLLAGFFKDKGLKFDITRQVIPDDPKKLKALIEDARDSKIDIIITTGGTGIGPRDFTPDVVRDLLEKEIPGVMEMIRLKYGQEKPNALLSRGVAGVAGESLIYTLPGSVRAVKEYMEEILKTLYHLIFMLRGIDVH